MTENEIARQLMACAAKAGPSEQKRAALIDLPRLAWALAAQIAQGHYRPDPCSVFAVTDPKLREIFAPAFADRLVQLWLIGHIGPWLEQRLIDDTYANRKGGGTHRAIARLQHFMRQPGHRWYCQLDIQAFFPSIERARLLAMWRQTWRPRLPFAEEDLGQLDRVAQAILAQDPLDPAPLPSGDRRLLRRIPRHKSLYGAAPGVGLPIGSLTSQCFANLYLDPLDQFVKHRLKVKGYLRYMDDMILLADDAETLVAHRRQIAAFLDERLGLALHPRKVVLQRVNQGANFLGAIVYPFHSQVRQRSVRALRQRLRAFQALLDPARPAGPPSQLTAAWQRWLRDHPVWYAPGVPNPALLQRMLATLNSYYGLFRQANTFRLRHHLYHRELGTLRRFFVPADAAYRHLRLRRHWLMIRRD
ncbi:RNA-directed DNA polymerase [Halomonas sp. 328]|uniref:RNA-directed DNA polymerase n=1 Tax=Halomonas sp. 328 TaxID=2776704 RepID=UPI0018A75F12|nr:RNA-directed DNA polymerase [Halomonas sp. 328]MBF8224475.1 RNA-dependent DNA polymerase [Halomonas sp. 328]